MGLHTNHVIYGLFCRQEAELQIMSTLLSIILTYTCAVLNTMKNNKTLQWICGSLYIHVCLSMLTQLSKTCGNVVLVHVGVCAIQDAWECSVGACRCVRCLRHVGTHMCMKLYVCKFIFPHVLDTPTHPHYIPMCLGRRPTTHQHDFIYYIHVCHTHKCECL